MRKTVSYTHLDVYKRQGQSRCCYPPLICAHQGSSHFSEIHRQSLGWQEDLRGRQADYRTGGDAPRRKKEKRRHAIRLRGNRRTAKSFEIV